MRLIDAEETIREIVWSSFSESSEAIEATAKAIHCIENMPSVERKKGRWINHRNDNGHNIADCSECGSAIQWFDGDEKPRFCCMCGADMRKEAENADNSQI